MIRRYLKYGNGFTINYNGGVGTIVNRWTLSINRNEIFRILRF